MQNYYFFLMPIITMLAAISMVVYVLTINFKSTLNRSFAIFTFSIFLWQIQDLSYWTNLHKLNPELFVKGFSFGYLFAGLGFLNFVYVFTKKKRDLLFAFLGLCSTFSYIINLTTDKIIKGYVTMPWGVQGDRAEWYVFVVSFNVFVPVILGLFFLIRYAHRSNQDLIKKQTNIIAMGGFTAIICAWIINVGLPEILNFKQIPYVGQQMGIVFIAFIFFAVIKFRFLTIDVTDVARELFSHVQEGIVILNNNLEMETYNKATSIILGSENIEHNFKQAFYQYLKDHESLHDVEVEFQQKSLLISSYILKNDNIQRGVLVFLKDMTAKKLADEEKNQLQTQLFRANQLSNIGVLASGVAHELNNPLTSVLGFVSRLLKMSEINDDIKNKLEKIQHAGKRMSAIINQLKRISRDTSQDQFEKCHLSELMTNSLVLLEHTITSQKIKLELAIPEDLVILGNPTLLESLFQNLLSNSRDAFENISDNESKFISIIAKTDGPNIEIYYQDNAGGFSNEIAEKLFIPFFTTKEVGKGTGLGMTIIHDTMVKHQGSIKLLEHIGGVKFQLTFPAIKQ